MNRKKLLLSYIIEFITFLFVCILTPMLLIFDFITSENYILNKLEKIDYYNKTTDIIKESLGNYVIQSGLDDEVMDNLVTEEKIKETVTNSIKSIYEDKEFSVDTKDFKENLTKKIDEYLENKQIEIIDRKSLDSYVDKIADVYTRKLMVYDKAKLVRNYYKKIKSLYLTALVGVLVITLVLLLIKFKAKLINGKSLLATGMVSMLLSISIKNSIPAANIYIFDKALSEAISTIYLSILNRFMITGIIFIILGLMIVIIKELNNKKERRN